MQSGPRITAGSADDPKMNQCVMTAPTIVAPPQCGPDDVLAWYPLQDSACDLDDPCQVTKSLAKADLIEAVDHHVDARQLRTSCTDESKC